MPKTIKTRSGRIINLPGAAEEDQINTGIAADADNPEWTADMLTGERPAKEFFSPAVYAELCAIRKRGPKNKPLKVPTTIRFDADVLATLKASGKGWQTRVNDAVKDWLRTHSPV
jgi:uncharacterized protein (DUF4415 family)